MGSTFASQAERRTPYSANGCGVSLSALVKRGDELPRSARI
jgi:hypothetical protein